MKNRISSEKNIIDTLCHLVKQLPVPDIEQLPVPDIERDIVWRSGFYYFVIFRWTCGKKELANQEEDWPDCSNTQVGMQKRWLNLVHGNH